MSNYYIVIPAYNEAKNIRKCIEHVFLFCRNIIVVNDGSTDRTREILDSIEGVTVIHLKSNMGKGYAMRVGAKEAWKQKAGGIIFMDGDNQHHPKHISEFIHQLLIGNDIVVGIRLLKARIPWHRKVGNNIMVGLMQNFFQIYIPDMMCGYRAFSKNGYRQLNWKSNKYEVEIEMLTIIGKRQLPYSTVVVDTIYLDKYKGFSIWDGIKILAKLPYYIRRKI